MCVHLQACIIRCDHTVIEQTVKGQISTLNNQVFNFMSLQTRNVAHISVCMW